MEYQYFTEKVWDEVTHDIIYGDCYYPVILEVFRNIEHTENSDIYEIETNEGLKFKVNLNYFSGEYIKDNLFYIAGTSKKFENEYDEIMKSLVDDDITLTVMFSDDKNRTTNTNEVRYGSVAVFKSLQESIKDSIMKKQGWHKKFKLLKFYVTKNDLKKAELYHRCIKRATLNLFNKLLIDNILEKDYDIYYYYSTEN